MGSQTMGSERRSKKASISCKIGDVAQDNQTCLIISLGRKYSE